MPDAAAAIDGKGSLNHLLHAAADTVLVMATTNDICRRSAADVMAASNTGFTEEWYVVVRSIMAEAPATDQKGD